MKAEIIILNFNGDKLLNDYLPSIIAASKKSLNNCSVKIIDNCSTDDSINLIKTYFPEVELIIAEHNLVLCSFNKVVEYSEADVVILLGNDVAVENNFVDPLVDIFEKYPDAFMTAPQCWTFDKSRYEGMRTKIGMKFGFFQAFARYPGYEKDIEKPGYTANAGSALAVRRDRFLELGGYDDLYLPGRMEDMDLCYRAWKRGYKAYYVPESMAYHQGGASFNKTFGQNKSIAMAYRNTFLFIWKNITGKKILFMHVMFLLPWLLFSLLKLNFNFINGFFQALPRFGQALSKRGKEIVYFKKTDKELFDLLGWKKSQ